MEERIQHIADKLKIEIRKYKSGDLAHEELTEHILEAAEKLLRLGRVWARPAPWER